MKLNNKEYVYCIRLIVVDWVCLIFIFGHNNNNNNTELVLKKSKKKEEIFFVCELNFTFYFAFLKTALVPKTLPSIDSVCVC